MTEYTLVDGKLQPMPEAEETYVLLLEDNDMTVDPDNLMDFTPEHVGTFESCLRAAGTISEGDRKNKNFHILQISLAEID